MTKLIIIGAGLAGLSAAISACKEKNNEVILISTMPSERAQSVMAEGGINGALNTKGENDSVEEHFNDTMNAGLHLANPNAVKSLTYHAPQIIKDLASYGTMFNRDDNENIDLRNFGGQKKKRTAFAKSSSGKQIMTSLIQKVRKYEIQGLIKRYTSHKFLKIIKNESDACIGCVVINTQNQELIPIFGDSVIISTGGMHGLFTNTTGSLDNTGIVTSELFTSGIPIANGEFIQFHPTTMKFSKKHLLISEAARGEGGRLFSYKNGKKWYFMEEKYPEMGNLMPRDVISREIWNILNEDDSIDNVYLDLTELPEEILENNLFEIIDDCETFFNINPKKEPIPIIPGIHYFMGGIKVDEYHRTEIKGLYAAGECACQYHGANRLGGNSLLGAVFGGIVSCKTALKDRNNNQNSSETNPKELLEIKEQINQLKKRSRKNPIPTLKNELSNILENSLDIVRNEETLEKGLNDLNNFIDTKVEDNYDSTSGIYENINFKNQCLLAKALIESAIARKESRGAHTRSDFPETNDKDYKKTTIARYNGKSIDIHFEEIPKLRE
ncbi:FAD-binding protein [Methanobrevibacter sp. OttesenSCG-928-K11]|nr:FAD-binding protein [Methanobrevibacter sp. OttesenSCG-928-K11]MDL2270595.1 FAD-binding protein [Methanobrevibacter sp. OttesenSCG-928-I08]